MSESQPAAERRAEALPPAGFVLLAALSVFWGLNWPAMKLALTEIPVWPLRTLCLIAGGGALLAISAAGGRSLRIATGEFRPLIICTVFNVVGWQLFSGYGVSLMEAGRASIIAFTMPVWAALLGGFLLSERTPPRRWAAMALGMAGLAVLMGPDLFQVGKSPLGALMMLGAAVSWAIGTVLLKRTAWSLPTAALTGWQLMLGAVPITIGALIIGEVPDPFSLSPSALGATLYIIVMPMIFCHWAWFKVVALFPTAVAAIGTLAIPVVGVLSSGMILGEPIGLREIMALALVGAALVMVLLLPALRPNKAKPR